MESCDRCSSERPPHINRCFDCGRWTGEVHVQTNPFWWKEEYVQRVVESAHNDSVTYSELAGNDGGWRYSDLERRPLIGYMYQDEIPYAILHAKRLPISIVDTESGRGWELGADDLGDNRAQLLVSDRRVLFACTTERHSYDTLISLSFDSISNIEVAGNDEAPSSAHALAVETTTMRYVLPVSGDEPLESLQLLSELVEGYRNISRNQGTWKRGSPDIAAVPLSSETSDEVNDIISESGSKEEAIQGITDQLRESWDERLDDEAVREAESIGELFGLQGYESGRQLPQAANRLDRGQMAALIGTAGGVGAAGAGLIDLLQSSLQNADPEQVLTTGAETAYEGAPIASAAPWSTPLVLGALIAGGVVTEMYKSAKDNTVVDDIDPSEVLRRAKSGADAGNEYDLGDLDGRKVGGTLSAARYVAESLTPEEYLELVMESDPELMFEGAELGVKLSRNNAISGGDKFGAAAGMAVGLHKSYDPDTTELSEQDLKAVLDDDLFNQYLGAKQVREGN